MTDRYRNFAELARREHEFTVDVLDRSSDVTVLAPHGGQIEPHTSDIAALIAGDDHNLFCFNGCRRDGNHALHLTSHRFDHPRALSLAGRATIVVAVHGCRIDKPIVYLGGLDQALAREIGRQLGRHRIENSLGSGRFPGKHRRNICNRGKTGRGVQLEISRGLRDLGEARLTIAEAVRAAVRAVQETQR